MKQSLLIAVLCTAIFSCTKENSIPLNAVPPPWRPSGVTPQASTYSPTQGVDCQHNIYKPVSGGCKKDTAVVPPPPEKDSCCR